MLLGAFLTYQYSDDWGLPFVLALLLAIASLAAIGAGVERAIIRPMVGKPAFAIILITLGLLLVIEQVVRTTWTQPGLVMTTPWGNDRSEVGGVTIRHVDIWTVVAALVVVARVLRLLQPHPHGGGHAGHRHRPRGRRGPGHQRRSVLRTGVGHRGEQSPSSPG